MYFRRRTLKFKLLIDNGESLDTLLIETDRLKRLFRDLVLKSNYSNYTKLKDCFPPSFIKQNFIDYTFSKVYNRIVKSRKSLSRKFITDNIITGLRYGHDYIIDNKLNLSISLGNGQTIECKIKGNQFDTALLLRIKNEQGLKVAELVKRDKKYYIYISVSEQFEIKYIPKTFIGIDLNESNITISAVKPDGIVLNSIIIEYEPISRVLDKGKKKLEKKHKLINLAHKISHIALCISKKYSNPIICLENLSRSTYLQYSDRPETWFLYRLLSYIQYKAKWSSIRTMKVDPYRTSTTCAKSRTHNPTGVTGRRFKCICGHQDHRDRNASLNIALKGIKRQTKKMPSLKNFSRLWKVRLMEPGYMNKPSEELISEIIHLGN